MRGLGLCLICLAFAAPLAEAQCFRLEEEQLREVHCPQALDSLSLPPTQDFASNLWGNLLILCEDGQLLHFSPADSLLRAFHSPADSWPLAISADGPDWLILQKQGEELLRLDRRGALLSRLNLPEGSWEDIAVDSSGLIWFYERGGRLLALGRSAHPLEEWDLYRRLPNFSGNLVDWKPDGEGGLYLLEEERLRHLDAMGRVSLDLPTRARSLLRTPASLYLLSRALPARSLTPRKLLHLSEDKRQLIFCELPLKQAP
ncbi:MAG: hypothetical protein QF492_07570 [Candidatus Krumholzibacteria bacterium]|jgi:hypothetical protein|nr:hypothetical protein [Candidatus Krumholzibacteria bacterium]MDP6669746.1 hypothetical protein [Candidatus Krumholzibacteria bacterium]MDP6796683.1 hypothetical protein [Candidatus Krumholzibacteria bacterium]MDP7020740.1 hypothetical protein [Candidatus Krumholzibacteria bacterium]